MPEGLDIARWQAGIPVGALRGEGIFFVIHKQGGANGGSLYTDSQYRATVPRLRAAGLRIGHYFFNGPVDAVASANYFVDNLSGYTADDVLALDIEDEVSGGANALRDPAWALAWFRQVRVRIPNANLLLYTTQSLLRRWDWQSVVDMGVRLWVAAPDTTNPYTGRFPEWAVHQYTWKASIAGFGPLDGNHSKDDVWVHRDLPCC